MNMTNLHKKDEMGLLKLDNVYCTLVLEKHGVELGLFCFAT